MAAESLTERVRRGDASAYLAWSPSPLDERAHDALYADALARGPRLPTTFYAHVPYCESSCNFCQYFHRVPASVGQGQVEAAHRNALEHLVARLARLRERVGPVPASAGYVGGGTPTAMPAPMLLELLGALRETFPPRGPLTVEAHPATLAPAQIAPLARAGVTRLSMGVQTLQPDELVQITRRNPPLERLADLVTEARARGVESNLDLVVGLPGQTRGSFTDDLARVLALRPDSVTVYRYQPTRKLAGGTLRLSEALGPAEWAAWTRAGYVGSAPRDGAESVVLLRVGGALYAQLARHARALAAPGEHVARYTAFGDAGSHMLGVGPGAIGHIWGRAWVREVTSVAALPAHARFASTPITPLEEARRVLRRSVATGSPAPGRALARLAGVSPDELTMGPPAGMLARGPWWLAPPWLSRARREALLDRWTPDVPAAPTEWSSSQLAGVERELVPLRTGRARGDLVEQLRALLGIPAKGLRYAGALVVDRDDTGLTFAVDDKRGARLRLLVAAPEDGRPSYVQTARFALRYSVGDRALSDAEAALLERLAASLRERDAAPDAPAD